MRIELAARLVALIMLWSLSPAASALIEAGGEPVRRFGYSLGDVVPQTLHLRLAPGQTLLEESLPAPGRAGRWFSRRSVVATPEAGGWSIRIEYQLINAPTSVETLGLPALRLRIRDGTRTFEESHAEVPVSAAALIPGGTAVGGGSLRPDAAPPLIDSAARWQRLRFETLVVYLMLLSWVGWYFGVGLRGRLARPFAAAEREIRRRLRHDASTEGRRAAMKALHRACDASAGATVQAESLGRLFEVRPALLPARAALTGFFAASRAEFFGFGDAALDAARLLELARQLKRLERQSA